MYRLVMAVLLTFTGTAGLLAQAPPPRPPTPKTIDPDFRPQPGDRAEILMEQTPAAASREILDGFVASQDRGDVAGMDREARAGNIVRLSAGTPVFVIKAYERPRLVPADPLRGFSIGEFERARRAADAREGVHPAGYPMEVRVLGGALADRVLVVEREYVGRMVEGRRGPVAPDAAQPVFPANPPRKKVRPAPRAMPPRPVDPATRAAATLQLGKNLKFDGNRSAAIEYFRKAIEQAPESPAGKEARSILKGMGAD